MLEDIQSSGAVEKAVLKGQSFAIINPAVWTDFLGSRHVGLGNIHAMGLKSIGLKAGYNLPYPTTNVQTACTWLLRTESIGVFGVELFIPAGEEFGIGFIVFIGFLMSHDYIGYD
jgi:hypothetical protein